MTDPRLPHLETALDPSAMAAVLQRECLYPSGEFELRECRVDYVRYKPGCNCVISYDLAIYDRGRDQTVRHILSAGIYEYETTISARRWRKAMKQPLIPVRFGPPVTHIAGLQMVVWAFPNDRRLTGLENLLDAGRLRTELLPHALPGERIVQAEPELVRYVPEDRCTVRVAVTTAARRMNLYAKTYSEDRGNRIHEQLEALWRGRSPDLRIPRPLSYDARTLWLEEMPGDSMESRFEPAAASAVAALHRQDLPALPLSDRPSRLQKLAEVWNNARVAGLESRRLAYVFQEIERRFDECEPLPTVTLHGDLTLRNLLAAGDSAGLIDLDELRRGDPLEDLGNFNAALYCSAVSNGFPMARADEQAAAFVKAYAAAVPWRIPERDLRWRTAHALVSERIGVAIKRRNRARVDDLLPIAERLLN